MFSYLGETNQLDDVSVTFHKGDFAAVIGQNGAGKTTLMRSIIGLLKPQSGKILVCGNEIAGKTVAELSAEVGYVFQKPGRADLHRQRARRALFRPGEPRPRPRKSKALVNEVLEEVGLERYQNTWPKYLSKGERQRLSMGAIITMDPEVVIVDEPTTGQDWRETLWIMDLLKKLNDRGKNGAHHHAQHGDRLSLLQPRGRHARRAHSARRRAAGRVHRGGNAGTAYVEPTDITKIAQALPYMPDDILSVQEFYDCFKAIRKEA